jgi:hypothetical protein
VSRLFQPVAWHTEDHLEDKSSTTYKVQIAQHWKAKGWRVQPMCYAPEWLPIETAPMDGTNVLLVNRKGHMACGLWRDGILGRGWFLRGGNEPNVFFNDHHGPTHWMPLPEAPAP